jgi:hypothetical protein
MKSETSVIDPEVAASEIVKTASDLFDGTLLRVREVDKNKKLPNDNEEGT